MKKAIASLLRRLGWALLVVFGVTTASFVIAAVLPGDPVRMLVGPQASAADVAHVRKVYGLDEPIGRRYVAYWRHLVHRGGPLPDKRGGEHESCASLGAGVHVDLGFSYHQRRPVADLVAERLPRTLGLALAALTIQLAFGLGAGVVAAARRGTAVDDALIGATLIGVSAPTFLSGLVLQYVLAYRLRLLPYDGFGTTFADHLRCVVLPATTLGIFGAALYARLARDEMIGVLAREHVRTARAKGASKARTVVVHGLRNALLPIATVALLDLGTLVGGAVVTERLFRWPGLGALAVDALLNRDGPVLLATVLVSSTAIVLSTLILDVVYVVLDPRLRR